MAGTLHRALLNKFALGTALALVIAPLAGVEQAEAACSPASGQDNVTVTCDSNTTNQDGTTGFGKGTETGVGLTVNSGVTVTGDNIGISLGKNNTVTIQSSASVTGTNIVSTGVVAGDGSTITNSGAISGTISGVNGGGALTLHNSGTVTAGVGVSIFGDLTVDNSNNITGISHAGISSETPSGSVTVKSNTGTISGVEVGIETSKGIVKNDLQGLIKATGANGVGIGGHITPATAVTLDNAGAVTALGLGGIAILGQTVTVNSNTGSISGDAFGINATGTAAVTNGDGTRGLISAVNVNGIAIGDNSSTLANTVTLANTGAVKAEGAGGIAIQGQTVNVSSNTGDGIHSGVISGDLFGIHATGTATVKNGAGGLIQALGAGGVAIGDTSTHLTNTVTLDNAGRVEALGSNGVALVGQTVNVVSNTGDIVAAGLAIQANTVANVTNAKNITGNVAINAMTANINNLAGGAISGTIVGIDANTLVLNNAGSVTVSGANAAVLVFTQATVNNMNSIVGGTGVFAGSLTLTNSGVISGSTGAAAGANNDANIVNLASGKISGNVGIQAGGPATITNFGTIQSTAGPTGTAIKLSSAADTLNIKRGSTIIGLIDMGGGADVINVDGSASSAPKGVSTLSRAAGAVVDALKQQLENFTGVINLIGGGSSTSSGQPSVTVNGTTASLDPTALAQQDRALMDFTGGMSSMVQDRLRGSATGSGPMAMSYAVEDAHAQMFNKALAPSWNAPVTVWSSAFGASRSQNGTNTTLDSTSNVFGGVIGVDRRIAPDWLVGMFAGGGSGALNVNLASQKVDTDYVSVGAYSRFEWASQFFDATLQGGSMNNRSSRLVDNTIAGSQERATASYNGWFISPEVAYGYRIKLGDTLITPTLRARYVAGVLDGYNETGSTQTLSVGSRTLQDFEERAEVEISKTGFFGDPSLKGWFRGGAIALQRVGDTTINAVLIGQSLSFVTPGKGSAVGGVGSVGFDYRLTPNVSLYGSFEGMMMSDESKVGSARGGVKVAF